MLEKDNKIFLQTKKKKKQQYCHERYKSLSNDGKINLAEYRKTYRMRKNELL